MIAFAKGGKKKRRLLRRFSGALLGSLLTMGCVSAGISVSAATTSTADVTIYAFDRYHEFLTTYDYVTPLATVRNYFLSSSVPVSFYTNVAPYPSQNTSITSCHMLLSYMEQSDYVVVNSFGISSPSSGFLVGETNADTSVIYGTSGTNTMNAAYIGNCSSNAFDDVKLAYLSASYSVSAATYMVAKGATTAIGSYCLEKHDEQNYLLTNFFLYFKGSLNSVDASLNLAYDDLEEEFGHYDGQMGNYVVKGMNIYGDEDLVFH